MTNNVLVLAENNPGINVDSLSAKSSRAIVASCFTCNHKWTTSKRTIANSKHANDCPACRKLLFLFGNNNSVELFRSIVFNVENFSALNKDKVYDFKCHHCGTFYQKTLKKIISQIRKGEDTCGVCNPIPKVKSGVLFAQNFPYLVEMVEENVSKAKLLNGKKYHVKYDCGHISEATLLAFSKQHDFCPRCLRKKSPGLVCVDGKTNLSTVFVECSKCKTLKSRKLRNANANIVRNGKFLCEVCCREKNSFDKKLVTLPYSWGVNNSKSPTEVTDGSNFLAEFVCENEHAWRSHVYAAPKSCPRCGFSKSDAEKELVKFLEDSGVDNIECNVRNIIYPYELDVFVPSQNIAIEFNGVYWHSENMGKDKFYHVKKTMLCREKGIQLIHVYSDDWAYRREIVESMLLRKLHLSKEKKTYGRNTTCCVLSKMLAHEFLEKTHIQGGPHVSSVAFGLKNFYGDLVAVMTFRKEKSGVYVLSRYASKNVVGGFSKLLKYSVSQLGDCKIVRTFADLAISNGDLYLGNGFSLIRELPPDYKYVIGDRRVHKFNYRKSRFKKDQGLIFEEGKTERELAEMNNLSRVWDCGKIVFELKI